jgi:hypothetical protein
MSIELTPVCRITGCFTVDGFVDQRPALARLHEETAVAGAGRHAAILSARALLEVDLVDPRDEHEAGGDVLGFWGLSWSEGCSPVSLSFS